MAMGFPDARQNPLKALQALAHIAVACAISYIRATAKHSQIVAVARHSCRVVGDHRKCHLQQREQRNCVWISAYE